MRTVEERFWAKVRPTGFCWEWTASTKPNGYGQFGVSAGHTAYAHRFAYELLVGAIPAGQDLDHLCRNRACVNPDHLDPVDRRTNIRRSPIVYTRPYCPRGHAWSGDNIGYSKAGRYCKPCTRARKLAER